MAPNIKAQPTVSTIPSTAPDKTKEQARRENHNQAIKLAVTAEQNMLLHYIPEILEAVKPDRKAQDDNKKFKKRYYTISKEPGSLSKILSFFSRGKDLETFSKIPNAILSSLLPDIKIYKVFHDKRTGTEFNWQIPFSDHTDYSDISKIFDTGQGIVKNVVLRSFTYDLIGTDFYTADKSIKAKLNMTFDSVDKLIQEINVDIPAEYQTNFGSSQTFKFSDLIMSNKEAFSKQENPNDYKIRVLVGIKEPSPNIFDNLNNVFENFSDDTEFKQKLKNAIRETKIVLALTCVGNEVQFNEDGTIDFNIDYHAGVDTVYFNPLLDVLLIGKGGKNLAKYMDDFYKQSENMNKLDSCFNSDPSRSKVQKDAYEKKIKAYQTDLNKIQLQIDQESVNIKSNFLKRLYEQETLYEANVGTKFKSVLKQLSNSTKPEATNNLQDSDFDKIGLKPDNIKRISGGDPTLNKIRDLYKLIQEAQKKSGSALSNLQAIKANAEKEKKEEIDKLNLRLQKAKQREDSFVVAGPQEERATIRRVGIEIGNYFDENAINEKYRQKIKDADDALKAAQSKQKALEDKLESDLSATIDFSGSRSKFILLGDLLNVGLECLDNVSTLGNFDTPEFILGLTSIAYSNLPESRRYGGDVRGDNKYINIYTPLDSTPDKGQYVEVLFGMENFPISVNRLNEFLVEKICKKDVKTYPFPSFIKDLTELVSQCTMYATPEQVKSVLNIEMSQAKIIIAEKDFNNAKEQELNHVIKSNIDISDKADPEGVIKSNEKFIGLTYFFSRGYTPRFIGKFQSATIPDKLDPSLNGVFEIAVGSKVGILKKINYTKATQPGFLEARMKSAGEMNNGNDGYPLRMKYNANITVFGPSIFRPGDYLELTPAVLSTISGDAGQLVMDQLGIGGFYHVLKASTTVSDTNFETVINAQFLNYKTGLTNPTVIPTDETRSECNIILTKEKLL
jgi:hypothetical protein